MSGQDGQQRKQKKKKHVTRNIIKYASKTLAILL